MEKTSQSVTMAEHGLLYGGMSGLVLPFKNRHSYPPALEGRSRIEVYGTLFNSIEINSVFYKLPRANTVSAWSQSVGENFRFTFKLWREISHCKGLNFNGDDLMKYFQVIEEVGAKRGCILVQFPPSVKISLFDKVETLLSVLQELNNSKWLIAVEFRSKSWYTAEAYDLLNTYGATMVYHDKSGSESPFEEMDAGHVYLRFHGPDGNYKGSYDHGFLYEYAGIVRDWLNAKKKVYIYFNNTMGAAVENFQTLEKFIAELESEDSSTADTTSIDQSGL